MKMDAILEHVNEKLKNHNLSLDNDVVKDEYKKVKKAWDANLTFIKKPINYVIIGEATVSFDNYFYNPNADTTSFLNPIHFGFKTKTDLINFFNANGVLVFDLYPLPLSTFIYDSIKFDCSNKEYKEAIEKYFDNLKRLITPTTKIILRYAKLYSSKTKKGKKVVKKRCESLILMDCLGRKTSQFIPIYSTNMDASEALVKDVFKGIIPSNH
jgi:hypothetical protein